MNTRAAIGVLAVAVVAVLAVVVLGGDGGGAGSGGGADVPQDVSFDTSGWETDFSQHSVPLTEFRSGGPPRDGIPPIDEPKHTSQRAADEWLAEREPVAVVELEGEARAYPIQILTWHEIVNDELGGEPIAVTFCPLCNATVAFRRTVESRVLSFGTTGNLRKSDLVMWDRQTESWWQQITAEAVVGELTGTELDVIPSQVLAWEDVQEQFPDAQVLSRDTGFDRDYGQNPYAFYDTSDNTLGGAEPDRTLDPKERVTAVTKLTERAVVYPFSRLREKAPVNDEIGDTPVVVLFDPEVRSALDDAQIAQGREVGAAGVFRRRVEGRTLDFEPTGQPGWFRDRQTGSRWSAAGKAVAGELEGTELRQVPSDDQFWFALAAFFEDPDIRR